MKTLKLKNFVTGFVLVLALVASMLVTVFSGIGNQTNVVAAASPKIVLSSNPAQLVKNDPYKEFTITARIEGVSAVSGGMYAGDVKITPKQASSLDFVKFVASKDVSQSATIIQSQHLQGIDVVMEGTNNGAPAITQDFDIGSFTFKLKQGTAVPDKLEFDYENFDSSSMAGDLVELDSGTFTLNFRELDTTNTLSALSISIGSTKLINGTEDSQTVAEEISYGDRSNLKISATRAGAASKIKVVDSVGNKTLVSERAGDLANQTLGTLEAGEHTLSITVTAESGAQKTYTVQFTIAQPSTSAKLNTLTLTAGGETIDLGFNPEKFSYEIFVLDTVSKITVAATADNNVTVDGAKEYDIPAAGTTITITVTPQSGTAGTYTIKVVKLIAVAKPLANGNAEGDYSGEPIDFTPGNMAELVSANKVKLFSVTSARAEEEVGINAFKPTDAGSYKVIARLNDGFYWQGTDGDTAPAEYAFEVNKAVVKATGAASSLETGKLPTFTSDSYKGSFDGVVAYKYYSDAACTQEVAAGALTAGTTYYVKAVLSESAAANFEFDSGEVTQTYVGTGFAYEMPKSSGNGSGSTLVIAGLPYWVWIIIAAAVLLLVILMIVLLVKRGRKSKAEDLRTVQNVSVGGTQAQQASQPIVVGVDCTPDPQEKLEERLHEIEHEAHEREITRYREEAERANEEAKEARKLQQPAAVAPLPQPIADSSSQERVKELEGRMREMERDAHERELTRYKEEVEHVRQEAEETRKALQTAAATPSQPVVDTAAQERVKELEGRMREMEREAHERELTRYKEEVERIKQEVEDTRKTMQNSSSAQTRSAFEIAAQERVKELEGRIREIEREAHERELAHYREEAEQAKKAAEAAERKSQTPYAPHADAFMQQKTMQQYAPFQASAEAAAQERVKEIEERLREMEKEAHERELAHYRDETQRAKKQAEKLSRKSRRQEEELQRLWELQESERRSKQMTQVREPRAAGFERAQAVGDDRLGVLEDQIQKQDMELQAVTDALLKRLSTKRQSNGGADFSDTE
jgi:hypothetical protein